MRILIVHNRYRSTAPSGENRVVDQESEALTALGHQVQHFERNSDDIEAWSSTRKATLPGRVVYNPETRRVLTGVLRRFRPDVVHIHNTFPLISASVLYACKDELVPVVATLHNYKLMCASGDFFRDGAVCHDCAGGRALPAVMHRCYRGSTVATVPTVVATRVHRKAWRSLVAAYVFVSESQRRLLAGMDLEPAKVFVKHNIVPYDGASCLPRNRQVAYVGRLDKAKGIPLLMRAWDGYRAASGDDAMRLMIAGGGPLESELESWARTRPSVTVAGHLGKPDCFDLIARSRAVLLPSQWEETFGLVAIEAMAAGVAPIAPSHGSFPELITDGRDGVLFRAGDSDGLAKVLQDIDRDPDRYETYGRVGRLTYERQYDPRRGAARLIEIYEYAMSRQPTSGR